MTNVDKYSRALITILILAGFTIRVWDIAHMPPGLNQDEASIGYEAFSILRYGVDRNGMSYPVFLISWGSGQNVLYAYFIMPFIAGLGLTPFSIRLPMVLAGTVTIALVSVIAKRIAGTRAGLAAAFFIAFSPWHIMLSRWGLEANFLPFVFCMGLAFLFCSFSHPSSSQQGQQEKQRSVALALAAFFFGLCMYAYGTSYFFIPAFLLLALITLNSLKRITAKSAIVATTLFAIVSMPIIVTIMIGLLHRPTMTFGSITMPAMIGTPRFMTMLAPGGRIRLELLLQNARNFAHLVWSQNDSHAYNVMPPYGYLYAKSFFFLACGGMIMVALKLVKERNPQAFLFVIWAILCVFQGLLVEPNITRNNLFWLALTLAMGIGLAVLSARCHFLLPIVLCVYLVHFGVFFGDYFSHERNILQTEYVNGYLPALSFASQYAGANGDICVTRNLNMPYISALFQEQTDPRVFASTVHYENPGASFQIVDAFGRYSFGLDRCKAETTKAVIALNQEKSPGFASAWPDQRFSLFKVLVRPAP